MNDMRYIRKLAAGAGLLTLTAAGTAAGPSAGNTPAFDWAAPVDSIETAANTIVIGDRTFVLAAGVRIHGARGNVDRSALHAGMTVGVRHDTEGDRLIVRELWVLPEGYQP